MKIFCGAYSLSHTLTVLTEHAQMRGPLTEVRIDLSLRRCWTLILPSAALLTVDFMFAIVCASLMPMPVKSHENKTFFFSQ